MGSPWEVARRSVWAKGTEHRKCEDTEGAQDCVIGVIWKRERKREGHSRWLFVRPNSLGGGMPLQTPYIPNTFVPYSLYCIFLQVKTSTLTTITRGKHCMSVR
jgi:hypothetical protein